MYRVTWTAQAGHRTYQDFTAETSARAAIARPWPGWEADPRPAFVSANSQASSRRTPEGHQYQGVMSSAHAECCTGRCECGHGFNAKTAQSRRAMYRAHLRDIRKCWAFLDDVTNVIDWAMRDQEECAKCGDEDGEREARTGLRTCRRVAAKLPKILRAAWGL